ncbi:MAG: UDP-4-amino-4,6-dideoxy-N-acetyl-beta-L-altrosamine transaminase [Sideroxyarcus sp.]|nr:UDP-4-amino-4,6-dideoxy-N-acetyl-beta-L-altrosamine transaminase [Sideroxyarcus sp.]
MIPYGRQDISEADIQAVVDVLRSDLITQGPVVPAFERAVADYCGAKHAVAVNNATSALHIACLALGVGKGDVVWTSPITFVASANCALYCGADVDFVDIDPHTYNMSIARLQEKLALAEEAGRLPKVVVPVHLCGQSCDMEGIHALGRRYGFKIIEDASHAIGGRYKGAPVGSCRYSDITVFSFHPVKIITTGEGGMAMTNDAKLSRCMQLLRSHGITREETEMTHAPDGPWYYQQVGLGFNYRMTDIQAALGLSQMHRLEEFISMRNALAARYDRLLAGLPVSVSRRNTDGRSAFHLYIIRLAFAGTGKTHRQVFEGLRAAGIGVNLHYIPVYLQPYHEKAGYYAGYCPEAERYYGEAISLPMYSALTEDQQDEVVAALREVLST